MVEPFRFFLRPFMRAWSAFRIRQAAVVPRPSDATHVRAGGPASDKVLLFGSGPSVGWGVLSHELALPGSLARALAARTGRGADVDVVASPALHGTNAIAGLASVKLARYDAVVMTIGINDAVRLTSPRRWEHALAALVTTVHDGTPHASHVFVVGIQPIRSIRLYDDRAGSIAAKHAAVLNAASERLCAAHDWTTFIPLPAPPVEHGRYRSKDAYQAWAAVIADAMAEVMDGP